MRITNLGKELKGGRGRVNFRRMETADLPWNISSIIPKYIVSMEMSTGAAKPSNIRNISDSYPTCPPASTMNLLQAKR